MRIKKIEWPAPFRGWLDRPTVEVALPFNSKAIIFRESPRMWVWKIIRWMAWDIQEGEASSLEKAKNACQTAWEKMVVEAFEEPTIKPLSWAEKDGNVVAYGANNMGFIIERGSDGYIVATSPEQQYTKSHFGFKTVEEAQAWCERYNKETVEEVMEWVK